MPAIREPAQTDAMAHQHMPLHDAGPCGLLISECLRAAIAAPSIHNSQPWLFRPYANRIDVLVDRRRQLRVADPDGRELHVSVGAALFNLRVAMLAGGREPLVRLLPDSDEPDLAATVTVGPAARTAPEIRMLAEAIPRRQTNRRPFGSTRIPQAILDAVVAAAVSEGGTLVMVDPAIRSAVLSLVRYAEPRQRADERYRTELAEWTAAGPARDDGVPPEVFGPRPELASLPLRDFDLAHTTDRGVARFEREPTLAVLSTVGDTRQDWLQAGQALERVLLTATAHGLATTPLTQILAVPRLRQILAAPHRPRAVQSILRLGYAGRVAATPRRPLADVVLRPPA
jgi:nitroreductase